NVLRLWLGNRGVQSSTRQLDALVAQIDVCRTRGHSIDIKVGRGFVRRIGDLIDWYNF
ncbi:MAG: tRNA(Ile)-lysidine synthetase, partial [Betaproteobacteria bacterium]|nr:tRNA(Ile)-lysidine synthetase [Betaproteobacteria bacterium]